MIKKPSVALFVFLCGLSFSAGALTGHDVEDGAGGIVTGKGVMTVGDSQISFAEKAETIDTIPGLMTILQWLNGAPIPSTLKSTLLVNLIPGTLRTYHRTDTSASDPQKQIPYAAATDKNQKITVLTPEFYQLHEPAEQAKILFREALSCISFAPAVSDEHLDAAVVAFQALLEAPEDPKAMKAFYLWLTDFFKIDLVLYPSLTFDLKYNGVFVSYKGRVPASQIFGDDFMECWFTQPFHLERCAAKVGRTDSNISALCATSLFCQALPDYFLHFSPRDFDLTFDDKTSAPLNVDDPATRKRFFDHLYFALMPALGDEAMDLQLYQDLNPINRVKF